MANNKPTDLNKIHDKMPYEDMTLGNQIYGGGGSKEFKTGEWRTQTPVTNWDKCVNCLLCAAMCPDSCIAVKDGKRQEIDYDHCKGCGICSKVCSFKAISMKEGL